MKENKGFFITANQRQHINLSIKAMAIIESDMIRFKNDYEQSNRSGFMNIIIENYCHLFPLAKDVVLKEINTIKKAISSDNFSEKLVQNTISLFTEEMMKNAITEYTKNVQYGQMFKLKLNSHNVQLLSTLEEVAYFEKYAPRSGLGFYLKALLESYTVLPKEKREEVYFAQTIEKIKNAIKEDKVITLSKSDHLVLRPIRIIFDPKLNHYVIRFIRNFDDQKGSFMPDSINIKEFIAGGPIYNHSEDSSRWKETKKLAIGGDFFYESRLPKEPVIVRFTESGLQRFLREEDDMNIIGVPDSKDKYVYTFQTTEPEAYYQLFKFGPQAVIVKPESIRNNFALLYKAANDQYTKKGEKQ
jgi:hypothetical protein